MAEISDTQVAPVTRSYKFSLRPFAGNSNELLLLYETHLALNRGTEVFLDWFLTLRGGLSHAITDARDKERYMITLALGWLSVESWRDNTVPSSYVVAKGSDDPKERAEKVLKALEGILKRKGVANPALWLSACSPALLSRIREDACWVNRSQAFDDLVAKLRLDPASAQNDATVVMQAIFGAGHNVLYEIKENKKGEKHKIVPKCAGAGQSTRHMASHIFGRAVVFGIGKHAVQNKETWGTYLKDAVSLVTGMTWGGDKEEANEDDEGKTVKTYSAGSMYYLMLAKAATAMGSHLTRQKKQEMDRIDRQQDMREFEAMQSEPGIADAITLLDYYCEARGRDLGKIGDYTISAKAISGWKSVVEAWKDTAGDASRTAQEKRLEAVKQLQGENPKFGDAALYQELAKGDYLTVWTFDGSTDHTILPAYVKGSGARADIKRLKSTSIRHINAYYSPVYMAYGTSKPTAVFARLSPKSPDSRRVDLQVWDGENYISAPFLAVSKRFDREIGNARQSANAETSLPKRVRTFGAADMKSGVSYVYDVRKVKPRTKRDSEGNEIQTEEETVTKTKKPVWACKVMPDRSLMEAIGSTPAMEQVLVKRLMWHMGVSLELLPNGPWIKYVDEHRVEADRDRDGALQPAPWDTKQEWRGLSFPFWHGENEGRSGLAKHQLSCMPGLRILSVDFKMLSAAACAVLEVISEEAMSEACRAVEYAPPTAEDMHLDLPYRGRREIFRRISSPERYGMPNEASWARIDRRFLIKLPGEKVRDVRYAHTAELQLVDTIEERLGYVPKKRKAGDRRISALQNEALYVVGRAVRRHATESRLAWGFSTTEKVLPGGRVIPMTEADLANHLLSLLQDWHGLFGSPSWIDEWAKGTWDDYIEPLMRETGGKTDEDEKLTYAVAKLQVDTPLRERLAKLWTGHWQETDQVFTSEGDKPGVLRLLKSLIVPKLQRQGKKIRKRDLERIWATGGLSLSRISRIIDLRNTMISFHQRRKPDGTANEAREGFAQRLLDSAQELRETRAEMVAARVIEAALGLGREMKGRTRRTMKRPRIPVAQDVPLTVLAAGWKDRWERKFQPCHAVVIRDLSQFRPDESRPSAVNKRLTEWSIARVRDCLAQSCQIHGLHLREAYGEYSNAQDSRTGMPGIRYRLMEAPVFAASKYWQGEIEKAAKKLKAGKGDARDEYLVELAKNTPPAGPIKLPDDKGSFFVSTAGRTGGDIAALNGAINLGLRTLLDPDWPGRWWYLACDTTEHVPDPTRYKGCDIIPSEPLAKVAKEQAEKGKKKPRKGSKEDKKVVNMWRNPCAANLSDGEWLATPEYWRLAEEKALNALKVQTTLAGDYE